MSGSEIRQVERAGPYPVVIGISRVDQNHCAEYGGEFADHAAEAFFRKKLQHKKDKTEARIYGESGFDAGGDQRQENSGRSVFEGRGLYILYDSVQKEYGDGYGKGFRPDGDIPIHDAAVAAIEHRYDIGEQKIVCRQAKRFIQNEYGKRRDKDLDTGGEEKIPGLTE